MNMKLFVLHTLFPPTGVEGGWIMRPFRYAFARAAARVFYIVFDYLQLSPSHAPIRPVHSASVLHFGTEDPSRLRAVPSQLGQSGGESKCQVSPCRYRLSA